MRDSYLQNLKKLSGAEKATINSIYQAALKASQQTYYESSILNNRRSFDVLEGHVKYDLQACKGIFYPSTHLKDLLDNCESKSRSILIEKNMSRFAALLVHAYKDFDAEMQNPYLVWKSEGHSGTEEDFIKWIRLKSYEEKERTENKLNT